MHPYVLLGLAIICELAGTTSLKLSEGFTRPVPSVIVVVGYLTSFWLMSQILKQIDLGMTYAIWSGVGTAGTVLIGVLMFKEVLDLPRVLGIVLIIAGVVVLQYFAKGAA